MEKKNTGMVVLIVILSLLVVGMGSFIVYDKVLFKDTIENEEENNKNNEELDTIGKVHIIKNGNVSLETVPNWLVGKYVNSLTLYGDTESYFEITENGEYTIGENGGGGPTKPLNSEKGEVVLYIHLLEDTKPTIKPEHKGTSYSTEIVLEFIPTEKIDINHSYHYIGTYNSFWGPKFKATNTNSSGGEGNSENPYPYQKIK